MSKVGDLPPLINAKSDTEQDFPQPKHLNRTHRAQCKLHGWTSSNSANTKHCSGTHYYWHCTMNFWHHPPFKQNYHCTLTSLFTQIYIQFCTSNAQDTMRRASWCWLLSSMQYVTKCSISSSFLSYCQCFSVTLFDLTMMMTFDCVCKMSPLDFTLCWL